MNSSYYLKRIGILDVPEPTLDNLQRLHLNHLYFVPFENLDIHLGITIKLHLQKIYEKIVVLKRGGFCYELNALFHWLLDNLGYETSMLAARVHDGKTYGPPFDYMLLLVQIANQQFLADVGFGDSFIKPLELNLKQQNQNGTHYFLTKENDGFTLFQTKQHSEPKPQYTFTLEPSQLSDFDEMCVYQQTSEYSHFTQKRICSIINENERMTISNNRFIITNHLSNIKKESPIENEQQYKQILQDKFGIQLSSEQSLDRFLKEDN